MAHIKMFLPISIVFPVTTRTFIFISVFISPVFSLLFIPRGLKYSNNRHPQYGLLDFFKISIDMYVRFMLNIDLKTLLAVNSLLLYIKVSVISVFHGGLCFEICEYIHQPSVGARLSSLGGRKKLAQANFRNKDLLFFLFFSRYRGILQQRRRTLKRFSIGCAFVCFLRASSTCT